ncbi:11481_t:CDS:1, partial [Racocetra persica]
MNKENPLDSDQIKDNINKLKKKLKKANMPLYQQLYSGLNDIPIENLTWKDPLTSQVISNDSKL